MTQKNWLSELLTPERALLCALSAVGLFNSYHDFQSDVRGKVLDNTHRIEALEARNLDLNEKLRDRRGFMSCAVRTLDAIKREVKAASPCELQVTE
jgi:hypothetical protein